MNQDSEEKKKILRAKVLGLRKEISQSDLEIRNRQIEEHLLSSELVRRATTIHCFVSMAIVFLGTYTFIGHWISYLIYTTFFILWAIVIYFFRDPERKPPEGEHLIISPADGKIVLIKEIHAANDLPFRKSYLQLVLKSDGMYSSKTCIERDDCIIKGYFFSDKA